MIYAILFISGAILGFVAVRTWRASRRRRASARGDAFREAVRRMAAARGVDVTWHG